MAQHDRRGVRLNAIPVINTEVFEDAMASDEYRAAHNGSIRSFLEGIPFTAKDSYMMRGLPVAAGSPAFQNLTAHDDAFSVGALRAAGAIPIGKTNMPPMANGGMQRGLYGRADSPYNAEYLTAAMGSGSSNGCGTSTASSMAVFGMAEETVSSGRSPASNNGLVAYTPSRGVLSIRGNWPLTYHADVVVPHSRSVKDLFAILDVIAVTDEDITGDFWRSQPFIELPSVESIRPDSFLSLAQPGALEGKRVGVPLMFIGKHDPAAQAVYQRPSVRALWDEARITLESLGATVEEVDFPLVTNHEVPPTVNEVGNDYPLPSYFNGSSSPGDMDAYAWDDFLHIVVNDTTSKINLAEVDPSLIFPNLPGTVPDRYGNAFNTNRTSGNSRYVEAAQNRNGTAILDIPGLGPWLRSLEDRRKRDLEDWMDARGLDLVVFPAQGDAGPEDAEVSQGGAALAWRNGVARSHGNFAIRQLGVPTVGVSMGRMADTGMPVDLTFASRAYDDFELMRYAYDFEQSHHGARVAPPRTPELDTDFISSEVVERQPGPPPGLHTKAWRNGEMIRVWGSVKSDSCGPSDVDIEVYVDGVFAGPVTWKGHKWSVTTDLALPFQGASKFGEINVPDASLAMVVVTATGPNGRSSGQLIFA